MRRFASCVLLVAALVMAAAGLLGGVRQAEARPPRYMWEPIIFQACLAYPVACDVIIVPG